MRHVRLWTFLLGLSLLGNPLLSHANPTKDSGDSDEKPLEAKYSVDQRRDFKQLDNFSFEEFEAPEKELYTELYAAPVSDPEKKIRDEIEARYQQVISENRFVDFLDLNTRVELPVGIKADIGVLTYIVLIDSLVITPRESLLFASMRFETPQGKALHFKSSGIKFSRNGGLSSAGKMILVGDYPINFSGDKSQLIIKGTDDKTYVEFDCNGYKEMSLDASFVFSRDLLLPENDEGEVLPEGNVKLDFQTTLVDFNDLIIEANLPNFQMAGLKDVSFHVEEAVLDLSDTRNAPTVNFPAGYNEVNPILSSGNDVLWQGFYVRELSVTLPPQFEHEKEGASSKRISFRGQNIVIDNVGFSGILEAHNLIPIESGKIQKWDFSLDKIYFELMANEIREAGFNGQLNVPLNNADRVECNNIEAPEGEGETVKTCRFLYNAQIKPGNEYVFNVSNQDQMYFDLWKADVWIEPTSYVEIKLIEGKFRPKAHLDGRMTINAGLKEGGDPDSNDDNNAKLMDLQFQDLEIQTVKPYLKVGAFALGSDKLKASFGGFAIQLNEIYGGQNSANIYLGFDITLALTDSDGGGFAANGRFKFLSETNETESDLKFSFKKVEVERFAIDIDQGSFKFRGVLNFYKDDEVYGNGISGTVDATFSPGFNLEASALFGTKNGKRYWYVDARVIFESGKPIFPPYLSFFGFGGGMYYGMSIDTEGVGSHLGETVSGMVYVPDENTGFGLKATVFLGNSVSKDLYFVEATYEMAFNRGGGLKYIMFVGNGYFLVSGETGQTELEGYTSKLAEASKGGNDKLLNEGEDKNTYANLIYGDPAASAKSAVGFDRSVLFFDFENDVIHGNSTPYMNLGGIIKGAGPGGRVGEMVLHIGNGEWYIWIGRPEYENRFAIEFLGFMRMDAYFVMGSVIPDSPPPPPEVSDILGGMDLDYMRDLNALEDGSGIGFGASFRMDTGDLRFLMFYARFKAGIGFDMMLKDYGDAECKGRGQVGLNGWYANSQAYGYFEGKIGIRIKLSLGFIKIKKKIDILSIGAAAVLQAKLPNPVWLRGVVGGRFSVLGGLVKGRCRFRITIGKECEVVNKESILKTIDVIAGVTPADNTKDVDVFTTPQVVFNFEVDKEYEMVSDLEAQSKYDREIIKFKVHMDKFEISDNGRVLDAEIRWNDDHTVAVLDAFEILPPEKDLQINIATSFQEYKNGTWVVAQSDGEKLVMTRTINFKTGLAPDHVPAENVAYSYPTTGHYNFYKSEYQQGYIKLIQGQSYLFEENENWDQVLRMQPLIGSPVNVSFTYIPAEKEVRYNIPQNIENDKLYDLFIVNVPKGSGGAIDSNVSTATASINSSDQNLEVQTRQTNGTVKSYQEKIIYTSYFRTSKYNSLGQKISSVNASEGWRYPISPGIHLIGSNIGGPEPFSEEEIYGTDTYDPLIQMEADLNNNPWYQRKIYPLIYKDYPLQGSLRISASNRDPNILGVIPTKAVFLYQYPWDLKITSDDVSIGSVTIPSTTGRYDYYLAYFMNKDFIDLSGQAANYIIRTGQSTNRLVNLIEGDFPAIEKGDYWIDIKYVLPGRNSVSSSHRHRIYNPID